ncbi:MAG: hypothetical protein ACI9OD_004742, partial [Limisphaerales bacterium]
LSQPELFCGFRQVTCFSTNRRAKISLIPVHDEFDFQAKKSAS